MGLFSKLFNFNEREIKRLRKIVDEVNSYEPQMCACSDEDLKALTPEFMQRLNNGASLESILPEAFAAVREVSKRVLGMRHFDVQIMGGIVLHQGNIAEMKTGEGKTLVATLPVYLNALAGKGVHVITVNDYLAKRDSEWMGQIYKYLGLKVGLIVHGMDNATRRASYAADVTYGTNNEFGFDYLRDNMVVYADQMVQREQNYAIVDEVDSILVDEARTPLIISGPGSQSTDLYFKFARIVMRLEEGADYNSDEKAHTVAPTEAGIKKVEKMLSIGNLYDHNNMDLSHYLIQALKAKSLMKKDRDYVVKDGQVIIVDEFTGRLMFGRRYSDGLHQAIEAKEGVRIQRESQTLATVTFQNYFRMYSKLAGMTGTAATEAEEFRKIYGMDVIVIPTNQPMIRTDFPDVIYKTEKVKFEKVVDEIVERHATGQPILVGTVSIERSEILSDMLKRRGIPHQVLNAKYHEKEADIVAQAGRLGSVTIATNMAGRGTDIILGGNPAFLAKQRLRSKGYSEELVAGATERVPSDSPEVLAAKQEYDRIFQEAITETMEEHDKVVALGGLHIIGTERHEARRIDNQLRGRSGRQGDPGSSRFYISLEDDLMRLFGSENIVGIMDRLGFQEDEPIEHNLVTKAIESAQKRVEARNFEVRRNVLEYDNVMNKQREVIYAERKKILNGADLKSMVLEMVKEVISDVVDNYASKHANADDWDIKGLVSYCESIFLPSGHVTVEELSGLGSEALRDTLEQIAVKVYEAREKEIGDETMRDLERIVMLRVVDNKWMDHLDAMDDLRDGIGLRAYGQRDPLIEYQREAYDMFTAMTKAIQEDIAKYMYKLNVVKHDQTNESGLRKTPVTPESGPKKPVRADKKIGRNAPCPCGSGKKYKKCCGKAV